MSQVEPSSRDPRWLSPTLIVLVALAVACALVAPSIAWLVIPLVGEAGWLMQSRGYRATASWTLPLLLVLAVLAWLPALAWVPVAAALAGAGLMALMLLSRDAQVWWLSHLPPSWLRQPWLVRVELAAYAQATIRGNRLFRDINVDGQSDRGRRDATGLRAHAVTQRARAAVWRGAWDAFIAQLDTILEMLATENPQRFGSVLAERRWAVMDAQRAAAKEMRRLDPLGVWIEQPGEGLVEDAQGQTVGRRHPTHEPAIRRGDEPAETIDDFLAVLPELRRDQLMVLAAAHRRADPAREAAWEAARAAIAADGRDAELERLRSLITGWATRPASTPTQWAEIPMAGGLLEQDVRRAAGPALLDAAVALFLGESLGVLDRDALLRPWHSLSAEREPRPRLQGSSHRRPR